MAGVHVFTCVLTLLLLVSHSNGRMLEVEKAKHSVDEDGRSVITVHYVAGSKARAKWMRLDLDMEESDDYDFDEDYERSLKTGRVSLTVSKNAPPGSVMLQLVHMRCMRTLLFSLMPGMGDVEEIMPKVALRMQPHGLLKYEGKESIRLRLQTPREMQNLLPTTFTSLDSGNRKREVKGTDLNDLPVRSGGSMVVNSIEMTHVQPKVSGGYDVSYGRRVGILAWEGFGPLRLLNSSTGEDVETLTYQVSVGAGQAFGSVRVGSQQMGVGQLTLAFGAYHILDFQPASQTRPTPPDFAVLTVPSTTQHLYPSMPGVECLGYGEGIEDMKLKKYTEGGQLDESQEDFDKTVASLLPSPSLSAWFYLEDAQQAEGLYECSAWNGGDQVASINITISNMSA